jgi:hypothetical protein
LRPPAPCLSGDAGFYHATSGDRAALDGCGLTRRLGNGELGR